MITPTKQMQISKEKFENLKKVIVWYNAMPDSLEVGDSFHDRMSREINTLLPNISELESDDYYSDVVEEWDGRLFVILMSTDDPEEEITIELVPA
jgi:hypothetical protein